MQDEIADIIMKEVGKGYKDAKKEVVRTADFIRYTIEEALHMHGESMMGDSFPGGTKSKLAIIQRAPLGVVLAIAPFNYPVNLSAAKLAPALIMVTLLFSNQQLKVQLVVLKWLKHFIKLAFQKVL